MPYANNKDADQPWQLRSLISAVVVRCLDTIISLVSSIFEISSLHLVSIAVQAGLCLTSSQTPKTGFLVMRLIWQQLVPMVGLATKRRALNATIVSVCLNNI